MADGVKRVERGIAYERARFVGVRKRGPVRGYLVYRGGYSYGPRDVIDFYGARPQYWLGWDNQGGVVDLLTAVSSSIHRSGRTAAMHLI